jgi:biotin carboxylase
MTTSKPILLLTGARSYRHNAFLDAAHRLGLDVLEVVDLPRELADLWHMPLAAPFSQPELALPIIVQYARQHPVQTVLATDDTGSLLAAQVAAALGLPHNSPQAALAARNKHLMRQLFAAAGVPSPQSVRYDLDTDPMALAAQIHYPVVLKPLLLSGSRGVIRANHPAEFVAAFARTAAIVRDGHAGADGHALLVETYIPGVEVALEGLLFDGQLTVLALFDKPDPLEGPFFEETIYVTPSRLPPAVQAQIAEVTAQAAAALGLRLGPVHAELRINADGPWMVEMAGRSIGGYCSQTLRFDLDRSLEELILRQAAGLDLGSLNPASQANGVMMIPIPKAGYLRHVSGLAVARAVPGIDEITISAPLDNPIVPLPEGASYLGFIFARGPDPAFVEAALRAAHACLHFDIEDGLPIAEAPHLAVSGQPDPPLALLSRTTIRLDGASVP